MNNPLSKRHLHKKRGWCLAVGILCTLLLNPITYGQDIAVYMNGEPMAFEVPPQITQGTTLVPLRTIIEQLGFEVEWNNTAKHIKAYNSEMEVTIELTIGDPNIRSSNPLDGEETFQVTAAPCIVQGRTFVPLRVIAEATGYRVDWNPKTGRIDLCDYCWSTGQTVREVGVEEEE